MRLVWPLLGLALLAVGCVTADPEEGTTPTPTPTLPSPTTAAEPTEVLNETFDFSTNPPEGPRNEETLALPDGARTITFTVTWESDTPTATTRGVRVSVFDEEGTRVADCSLDTNVVTQVEGRACGPQTSGVGTGAHKLTWEGFGNVRAHVVVASG